MYGITLRMDELLGIEIEQKEFHGKVVPFISFPMEVNGLMLSNGNKNKIRWNLCMYERSPNIFGQSHYLSIYIKDPKIREFYKENGWDSKLRFFGVAKDFGSKRMQSSEGRKLVKQNDEMYGMDNE